MTESILEEAQRLVNGDRKDTYDGTDVTIVSLWSAYLGVELTVLDYAAMMVLLKVARTKGKLHRDSWVDIAGYAEVGPRLWEAKQDFVQGLDLKREAIEVAQRRGIPRVWDSLTEVPANVRVRDKDGDIWEYHGEYGWRWSLRGAGFWYEIANEVANARHWDKHAPFIEVLARHSQEGTHE